MKSRWGLAVIVNLGAAVVAAIAFGAWRQAQSPANPASHGGGFYEPAADVGYIPRASIEVAERGEVADDGRLHVVVRAASALNPDPGAAPDSRVIYYDVTYTTGPDHFRVVPRANEDAETCFLLFGDSFTFGIGVRDGETYAAQLVKLSGGKVAVHNFAVGGWGPHHFLAGLQSGRVQNAVRCKPTDAVFLMIPQHIWRVVGVPNAKGPRYRLGPERRPVRDGALGEEDAYNWRRWIGLPPTGKDAASRLAAAIITEAMGELRRIYPGIRTHFISYRVASWIDMDLSADDLSGFEHALSQAGIVPLPLEAIIPRFRFAIGDYVLHPRDTHPNARAHRLIAEFILREMTAAER